MDGTTRDEPGGWYEIRLDARLDPRWASRFHGFDLSPGEDGTTVLRGRVIDQAALHGVLHQVRDIGVPIISVAQADLARAPEDPFSQRTTRRTP